jgi:hypothetical protein
MGVRKQKAFVRAERSQRDVDDKQEALQAD